MRLWPLAWLVVLGCTRPQPQDSTAPAAVSAAQPAVRPAPEPGRFECQESRDCINTCGFGAVNARWFEPRAQQDCDDGCADSDSAAPRCEEGRCVAYYAAHLQDGGRRAECTGRGVLDGH